MSLLLALALGTLVSEDLACIAAGLMIGRGEVFASPAILACALGIYAGDLALWGAGRVLGPRLLAWPRIAALLPAEGADRFAAWFARHARSAILGSRVAPGTRLPLYLAAGACRTPFGPFAAWTFVAVSAWTPLLVGVSALLGESDRLVEGLAAGRILTLGTVLLALLGRRLAQRLASARVRAQIAASMSRIWRWEFWPMWLFYAPVAIWTAWLALRHGGYRTLTAANPGMPDGGVVGESKFDILSRLPSEWVIPSGVVEPGPAARRIEALRMLLGDRGWSFPLVLKPDVGQRGTGVRLARTAQEATAYLAQMPGRVLVQPYHQGPFEAGVFYYRMPGSARGRVLAMTDKHFPTVSGDGRSTLEELVWGHTRYRMQARTFIARLGHRRTEVPAAGERRQLGIAGNHAQGTMFTDGLWMLTPALERRIDAIASSYEGFFIGRFDIRYQNRAAFRRGEDLAIVELNGATAECTNIYDPDGSLLSAYRQLFLQWRLVFAIGAANRRDGRAATSTQRLLGLIRAHLRTSNPFPVSD
jgi:membrane protein DedA with SNARE-associated domain